MGATLGVHKVKPYITGTEVHRDYVVPARLGVKTRPYTGLVF